MSAAARPASARPAQAARVPVRAPTPAATPVPAPAGRPAPAVPTRARGGAAGFARAVYEVARKEVLQHIRTKRLLIIGSFLVLFLTLITLVFGPQVASRIPETSISKEHLILAFYFGVFGIGGLQFTQLLSIVVTADAVCSEWSTKTIFLLLSKPVSRVAFVTGKFLGNLVTVSSALLVLFLAFYALMQPLYDGSPSGKEVAGFFGMLGLIILGSAAFAAISLFFSTLTKSTATSMMSIIGLWLIGFPLLGSLGALLHLGDGTPPDAASIQGWRYLNPVADMQAGARLLLPESNPFDEVQSFTDYLNPFNGAAADTGLAILSLAAFTVVFFGASLLLVKRRNFE